MRREAISRKTVIHGSGGMEKAERLSVFPPEDSLLSWCRSLFDVLLERRVGFVIVVLVAGLHILHKL